MNQSQSSLLTPRALLFIDYSNVNKSAVDQKKRLDYEHLRRYLGTNKVLLESYCFVGIPPHSEHNYHQRIQQLQRSGYLVFSKIGTSHKANLDTEITISIMKIVNIVRPDVVVLVSGDGDFVAIVTELRQMGIRTEIAGFKATTSKQLILTSNAFINLDEYYQTYYPLNPEKPK